MIKKGVYRHFKGKEYQVLGIVKNSETLEPMVLYKALYGDQELWVRPEPMFSETVLVEGARVERFTLIAETSDIL